MIPGPATQASTDFFLFFFLIIYFSLCWVFIAASRFSLVAARGSYPVGAVASVVLGGR